LVEDTIVKDNTNGVTFVPNSSVKATLNRITANNNTTGVILFICDSVVTIANSTMSNNNTGVRELGGGSGIFLAKNVISGNGVGVVVNGGTAKSYGDNYINNNTTPVTGTLTSVGMQ
jgi:hypothetical protein